MKKKGNWDKKRPGTAERLSSRLAAPAGVVDSLGGLPDLTTADFAAAVGMVSDNLQRIVLSAKYGRFFKSRIQLKEIVVRRSWTAWGERKNAGNLNVILNDKIAILVLSDWYLSVDHRNSIGDTQRAKQLGMDYRRYKGQFKNHHRDLVSWLDAIDAEALRVVRRKLRK